MSACFVEQFGLFEPYLLVIFPFLFVCVHAHVCVERRGGGLKCCFCSFTLMYRLTNCFFQGDVGCGKTIVAFLACMEVISSGYQVWTYAGVCLISSIKYLEPISAVS